MQSYRVNTNASGVLGLSPIAVSGTLGDSPPDLGLAR